VNQVIFLFCFVTALIVTVCCTVLYFHKIFLRNLVEPLHVLNLQGDYTRTGERRFAGMMKDGVNSANRLKIIAPCKLHYE
jgi:hypothetical protein